MSNPRFATPAAVEAAFYAAFAATDLDAMEAVWAPGLHTLCIHPGGPLLRGKPAVIQSWMEIFSGAEPPVVEHDLIESFEGKDLCVRLVEERIRPRGRPPEDANLVLATNVYVLDAHGWHLGEHHASLPLIPRREGKQKDAPRLH